MASLYSKESSDACHSARMTPCHSRNSLNPTAHAYEFIDLDSVYRCAAAVKFNRPPAFLGPLETAASTRDARAKRER